MQYPKGLVSIGIVTFNQEACLETCIRSLLGQDYPNLEIIVVNNSPGPHLNNLKIEFPVLKIINNTENHFFASAQNQGIRQSIGEFVLCLNDDVVLESNFIKEALRGFEKNSKVGMVSGKILSFHNKKIIDSTGLFLGRNRKPVERGYRCIDQGQFDQEGYIFGVSGAVGMYKKEMLEDISLNGYYFDAQYKIFYEDLDLSWRAQNRGWKAYYIPQALAYHIRGKTVKKNRPRLRILRKYEFAWLDNDLQIMLLKNRYSTIIKNDMLADFFKNLLFVLIYEIRLWSYILLMRLPLVYELVKDLSWLLTSFKKRKMIFTGKIA